MRRGPNCVVHVYLAGLDNAAFNFDFSSKGPPPDSQDFNHFLATCRRLPPPLLPSRPGGWGKQKTWSPGKLSPPPHTHTHTHTPPPSLTPPKKADHRMKSEDSEAGRLNELIYLEVDRL